MQKYKSGITKQNAFFVFECKFGKNPLIGCVAKTKIIVKEQPKIVKSNTNYCKRTTQNRKIKYMT